MRNKIINYYDFIQEVRGFYVYTRRAGPYSNSSQEAVRIIFHQHFSHPRGCFVEVSLKEKDRKDVPGANKIGVAINPGVTNV